MKEEGDEFLSDNNDSSKGTFVIFASLYLVLLSFFILLNTISQRDLDKTEKGMLSIVNVFSTISEKNNVLHSSPQMFDFDFIVNSYYQNIRKLVTKEYQLFDVNIEHVGNTVVITFPIDAFFNTEDPYINRKKEIFLNHLMEIVTTNIDKVKMQVNVSLSSKTYLKFDYRELYKIDIKRADILVQELGKEGIPPENIRVGLRPDNLNVIMFEFNFFEP